VLGNDDVAWDRTIKVKVQRLSDKKTIVWLDYNNIKNLPTNTLEENGFVLFEEFVKKKFKINPGTELTYSCTNENVTCHFMRYLVSLV